MPQINGILVVIYFTLVSALEFQNTVYQYPISEVQTTTLESKYDNNHNWTIPSDTIPKWFKHYNSTTHFINEANNTKKCASISHDFGELSGTEGIWVACQDPELPLLLLLLRILLQTSIASHTKT